MLEFVEYLRIKLCSYKRQLPNSWRILFFS